MKQVLAILFLAAVSAAAQTASISDTLTAAAGGGAWKGKITVALNNPGAAQPLYSGTTSLAGWSRTLCLGVTGSDCAAELSAGVVTITLYANDSITPAGTSYSVRFVPTRGSAWVETWTVETADTKLYQIRSTTTPTPTTTFQSSQLALTAGRLLYGSSTGVGAATTGLTWDQTDRELRVANGSTHGEIYADGTDAGFRFVTGSADVFFATDGASAALYAGTPDFSAGVPYSLFASEFAVYGYSSETKLLGVTSTGRIQIAQTTPASSAEACEAGTLTADAHYVYVCTSTNTWKRAPLEAF